MSKNEGPHICKPRFKGVENFLRRVAFNLGNSPSQTEVKIISCIPIDVTDLQQKIINLEKQLEEAQGRVVCGSNAAPPVVQTALCRAYCVGCDNSDTCPANQAELCQQCFIRASGSATSTPIPPQPPPNLKAPISNQPCTCFSSDVSNNESKTDRKGIFKKAKKKKSKEKKKKDKQKTQFVYYAQTTTGPFNEYVETTSPDKSPTREGDTMSRTYISEVIRKQYAPVPIAQECSKTSQFSSPVCRDIEQTCPVSNPYESDLCSCCHGTFHNIDHHMATHNYTNVLNTFPAYSYKECMNNASFYDSSLYDMVPVRDKPARTATSCYESPKRKVPKSYLNATYYPERVRPKNRSQPLNMNHYARIPPIPNYTKRTPVKVYSTKEKVRRRSPKDPETKIGRIKHSETSDSCCIDCGNVYIKRVYDNSNLASNQIPASIKPKKSATCKNAECLTNILNDTECQTTTTQSVQIDQDLLEEKKTEETLNQIKSILQSVLTEVKTSTQLKKTSEVKDKPTKDAVVQKGMSQGNMPGCSSLLHSFTYSPYNMNPYMASCSRQMNSGPCCFQGLPYPSAKCMQNFPVFIQTPGRHMCASCYRHSSHFPKVPPPRPATTTATNTDSKERSKETEKLIKEIYKSMAVNMEFPTKDTSASEYNDLKSTPRVSINKSLYRPSVLDEGMRKFMKANGSRNLQKSATPITTMNSKLMSNTLSMRSQFVSTTDTERNARNHRIENYLENIDAHMNRQNKIEEEREYEEETPETTASDDEASYSEASVREACVQKVEEEPVKKPEKKGLFSKMFKSVKLFNGKSKKKSKKKEEEVQVENEVDEESDGNSDDYQTIYSQRVDRKPRYVPHAVRSPYKLKAHSKISYSRHMRDRNQERSKRPYMEQEYRRHWNERLMFQESRNRYSSDTPFSKGNPRHVRDPVYWQNYEARSAIVNNNQQGVNPRFNEPNHRPTFTREDLLRSMTNESEPKVKAATKGIAWLKKHKLGIRCGEQWKKLILEG